MADETTINIQETVRELREKYPDDVEFLNAARRELVDSGSVPPLFFTEVMGRELSGSKAAAEAWPSIAKSISPDYGYLVGSWAAKSSYTYVTVKSFVDGEDLTDSTKTGEFNKQLNQVYTNLSIDGNGVKGDVSRVLETAYITSINNYSENDTMSKVYTYGDLYGENHFVSGVIDALDSSALTSQGFVSVMDAALKSNIFSNNPKEDKAIDIDNYDDIVLEACEIGKVSPKDCCDALINGLKITDEDDEPIADKKEFYSAMGNLLSGKNSNTDNSLPNKLDVKTFETVMIESFKYHSDKKGDFISELGYLQEEGKITSKTTSKILTETAKFYNPDNYIRNVRDCEGYLSENEIVSASLKIFETDYSSDIIYDTEEEKEKDARDYKTKTLFDYYDRLLEDENDEYFDFSKEDYLKSVKEVAKSKKASNEVITDVLLTHAKNKTLEPDSVNKCVDDMYKDGSITYGEKIIYDVLASHVSEPPIKDKEVVSKEIAEAAKDEKKKAEMISALKNGSFSTTNFEMSTKDAIEVFRPILSTEEILEIAIANENDFDAGSNLIESYKRYRDNGWISDEELFKLSSEHYEENKKDSTVQSGYLDVCEELYKAGKIDATTYKKKIDDIRKNDKMSGGSLALITDEEYQEILKTYKKDIDESLESGKISAYDYALEYKKLLEEKNIEEKEYKEKLDTLYKEGKIDANEYKKLTEDLKDKSDLDIEGKLAHDFKTGKISMPEPDPMTFEITKDGKTESTSFDAGNWYEKILNYRFEPESTSATETIDVIEKYGWNINSQKDTNNIPHCYVVEYEQLYNSSITNIITSIMGLLYTGKHMVDNTLLLADNVLENVISIVGRSYAYLFGGDKNSNKGGTALDNPNSKENDTSNSDSKKRNKSSTLLGKFREGTNSVLENVNSFATWAISNLFNTGDNPVGVSEILAPYRMMYILKRTGKNYCFPMMDKSASSFKASNKMEEKEGGEGSFLLGNAFFSTIANLGNSIMGVAQDIEQIAPFFAGTSGANSDRSTKQYFIERSKYFSYPTDGEDINTSFILYNTVSKDIWKKHYSFILGFMLRNLPYKQDIVSYYPPLFYDVIIPGVKKCPYCYVESFDVSPLGLTRRLSISGREIGLNQPKIADTKYEINVPEAWMITIKFKSLLGTSANQILSSIIDNAITSAISTTPMENKQ